MVVDQDADRITALELENLTFDVPSVHADASESEVLLDAGLCNPWCNGVIAVTRDDQINLKVAIASRLLNPRIKVYCWAESHDTGVNMASFETDEIIYPYDTFAKYFTTALDKPSHYLIRQWLTSPPGTPLSEPVFPPRGRWILCGYGRFGKAVYQQLTSLGLEVSVIEESPDEAQAPEGTVSGRGTEAETLNLVDIDNAVGIVAGSDHDVNNLSIILTARALNAEIFTIARQESASNDRIFDAAGIDLVFNHSNLISREILSLVTAPMTADFLRATGARSEEWSRQLVARLLGAVEENDPNCWAIALRPDNSRAFMERASVQRDVELHHLIREPGNRKRKLPCVALMIQRGDGRILLPDDKTKMEPYDQILLAGEPRARTRIVDILSSPELLHYMVTGQNRPSGYFWRWMVRLFGKENGSRDSHSPDTPEASSAGSASE